MTVNVFKEALRTVTGYSHTRLSGKRQRVIRRSSLKNTVLSLCKEMAVKKENLMYFQNILSKREILNNVLLALFQNEWAERKKERKREIKRERRL